MYNKLARKKNIKQETCQNVHWKNVTSQSLPGIRTSNIQNIKWYCTRCEYSTIDMSKDIYERGNKFCEEISRNI